MEQSPLFFEDIYDAFRHIVQTVDPKVAGPALFPQKNPDDPTVAGKYLMDCLNPHRSEKIDLEQMLLLLRLGRKAGCHSAIDYINRHSGYTQPQPIEPDDEKAELQRQFIRAVTELRQMASKITAAA